jgi:uncharacterized phiE125 gp8 family phage protein
MVAKLEVISRQPRPVTVAEARAYCRLYDTAQDSTLEIIIDAAVEFIEAELRESLRQVRYRWTGQPREFFGFPRWPVAELQSIEMDGLAVSLEDYQVDRNTQPEGLIGPLSGTVVIEWTAGLEALPPARKLLVLAVVAEFVRNREAAANAAQLSTAVRLLLQSQKSEYDAVR